MILRPGVVTVAYHGTGATVPPPIIVGTQPVWSDDDDASYAVSEHPAAGADIVKRSGPGAIFTGFPSGAVTALALTFRASMTSEWATREVLIEVQNPPVTDLDLPENFVDSVTFASGAIEEHTISIPWLESYRTTGMAVNFSAIGLFGGGVWYGATATIYDVRLDVTATGTKRPKPVRMYPANHPALGTHRQYPPARSRAAGRLNGYQ